MKLLSVRVDEGLQEELEKEADRQERKVSQLCRVILINYFKKSQNAKN